MMPSNKSGTSTKSAEKDAKGDEYLPSTPWKKMSTSSSISSKASEYFDELVSKVTGNLEGDDLVRVMWLSCTLFFIVGGYWLLRSLKDPIMSVINGVEYIPSAKIASLFVVFGLVIVCKSFFFNRSFEFLSFLVYQFLFSSQITNY
jgi:AAA family ATP:ADP antiporter